MIFDLLILAFFKCSELLMCHSELCRLVSGSYSKIHDSSPVWKNFRHFQCVQEGPDTHSFSFPFVHWWDFWNQLCTNFLHAQFLGKNVVDGSVIQIQHTTDRSFWLSNVDLRAFILVTFLFVFYVQGVPEQGSSSTLSWPSKIALCHLKICTLYTACSL